MTNSPSRKRGRPPIGTDRIEIGLRLPKELFERSRREAEEREVSFNYLVIKALERYLDEHSLLQNEGAA